MPPRRAFFVSAGSVWSKTHCGCARFRPGLIGAYRRFVYPHCQRSEGIFLFAQYSPSCDHGLVKPVACIECSRGRNQTALVRTPLDGRGRTSSELLRCSPQRPVMETAGFGKAKTSAYDSVRSAATYLAGLSTIAASYIGLTWSALLVPAINPAATLIVATNRVRARADSAGRLPDLAGDFSGALFISPPGQPTAHRVWLHRDRYSPRRVCRDMADCSLLEWSPDVRYPLRYRKVCHNFLCSDRDD